MIRLIGIVVSIGLADSLNPTTIAPALYLATGDRARGRVAEFTAAVFAVYFIGGAAIAVGAGQLIRPLLPHPRHHIAEIVEIAVGAAMIAGAALLWRHRARLARRDPPDFDPQGKSSWVLGASITAVELPTAFPYFAAIAAIVGSGLGPVRDLVCLVLFNLCFISPLLAILAVLTFAGDRADELLSKARGFLQRHWPAVLAGLALAAGLFVVALGLTGLAASHSSLARRLHHTLRSG
jgi:cytochrome c biogenesis protein CcdA